MAATGYQHYDDASSGGKFNNSPGETRTNNMNYQHQQQVPQRGNSNFLEDTGETRMRQPPVTLPSGAVYTGEWRSGMRDGEGTQEWPDGSKYVGYW